jgi:para-nitrobenzyl esterase
MGAWRLRIPSAPPVLADTSKCRCWRAARATKANFSLACWRCGQPDVCTTSFDWDELPSSFDNAYGAAHSFDLPSIFGNFGPSLYSTIPFSRVNRAGRLDLSAQMMQSIGSFARDGDPNSASLGSVWPAWPRSLVFDSNLEAARLAVE